MVVFNGLILELCYETFAFSFILSDFMKYLNNNTDKHRFIWIRIHRGLVGHQALQIQTAPKNTKNRF